MDENPYQPPPKIKESWSRRNVWQWVLLAGAIGATASAVSLCGTANIQHGGVNYLNATQAFILMATFASSALALGVSGVAWLISRRPRRDGTIPIMWRGAEYPPESERKQGTPSPAESAPPGR